MSVPNELGRRRLLIFGAAATVCPACSSADPPLGGPYGGTGQLPPPTNGSDGGATTGSSSGGEPGGGSSSSSSSGGGSSSSSSGSSGGDGGTCAASASTYEASFADNPGLMTVGSGVTVSPPNYQDSFGNDSIYIVQEAAGVFIAYSLSCTHQGCLVTQSGSGWRCACHGATYSATGGSPTSPANTPLQSYTVVCVDATGVTLALT